MGRSIKIFVFILLSALFIGAVKADCPKGDLNGDCKVDFLDISVFAEQWLELSDSDSDTNFADFDGVDGVNVSDFALLVSQWHQAGVPLVINEFMASNNSFIQDPQGQYDDWIEIYNLSSEAINVAGMYLTDNLSVPAKWQFPSDNPSVTTIPPQGYLLIWADENITDAGLHASFKLDGGGEELGLFDSDGSTLIDSIVFNGQTVDISYGRFPDAADDLRFFAVSTPGAENVGAYSGEVDEVKSSHKHGFYDVPFYVTLATETEGADIYYTLDGSEPYEFVGRGYINGAVYNGPILISSTTCLRAKAVKPGWKSSQVKTITYLMGVGEARRSLPAVSLVGDYGKTFYEPNGVMAIVGGYYGADGRWVSNGPDTYNNVIHRGMAYERPVSFELIQPGDNSGLQIDCGIRVHGSDYMRPRYRRRDGLWSGNAKFSFRLYFRSRYGEKWLEYPLFPFEVDRFRSIALRGGHNDRTNPFIKDELLRRLHKDMGNVASGGMNANLFINGEYKGYFNPCEHIKNAFCQEWYESDKDWDVMTMSGVRDGDAVAWNEMINYARSNNLSNDEHYQCISQLLDIPSFVDYLILQLWCGNWDWPQNNWSAARERSDEGMWRFFIWDAEGGMFSDRLGTVYFDRLNSQSNANGWLYRALKNNSNFKQLFSDRIYKHFYNNGALTEDNIRERFLELREEMSGVIPNMNMYVLDTWVPERLSIFLNACIQEGMYTFRGPTFEVNGFEQQGGEVSTDDAFTLTTLGRSQVIYYTIDGSDPRLPVESPIQTTSTTLVAENAAKHVLVPTGPVSNDWRGGRGFNDSVWLTTSGYPGGVGYERNSGYEEMISLDLENRMYGTNPTCYVRIPFDFNFNLSNFDFMTLKMRYDDGFVAYLNGTEVARRGFTGEPTWNSNADTGRSDSEAVNFEHIDISLFLNTLRPGNNILAIQGLNTSTTSSDLLISTELVIGDRTLIEDIEIVSPSAIEYTGSFNLDNSACVKARVLNDGIWSALNEATFSVGPVADNLRITEIMYNPYSLDDSEEPNEEYVELQNIGAETINLNLVKFTNGVDFTFPNIELASGEYIVVVQDIDAFQARYGQGINVAGQYSGRLNNAGERIKLEDAIGQTILDFSYRDGWRSVADGEGFSLTIINPGNTNSDSWNDGDSWRASAYLGGSLGTDDSGIIPNPGAIVINELLANSPGNSPDWIELHNTTNTAIDIGGWCLSDSGSNLTKFEIAAGTVIPPNGYVVFYEDLHFGNPGFTGSFALSEDGERVYLSSAEDGILTGYRQVEDFGASATGVSFGRYYKSSTGNYNFVAISENTPGFANAYPKVGPIVITEIMYNPSWPEGGSYTNEQYEYVELYNISTEPVSLEGWQFTDGIDFAFPEGMPVTIPAGGYMLVVRHPEAFMWRYPSVPADNIVYGFYEGNLSNAGERLELSMPSNIRVDRVSFSDGSHPEDCPGGVDLWPVEADGSGSSLIRRVPSDYGNDPDNWSASTPSPGE